MNKHSSIINKHYSNKENSFEDSFDLMRRKTLNSNKQKLIMNTSEISQIIKSNINKPKKTSNKNINRSHISCQSPQNSFSSNKNLDIIINNSKENLLALDTSGNKNNSPQAKDQRQINNIKNLTLTKNNNVKEEHKKSIYSPQNSENKNKERNIEIDTPIKVKKINSKSKSKSKYKQKNKSKKKDSSSTSAMYSSSTQAHSNIKHDKNEKLDNNKNNKHEYQSKYKMLEIRERKSEGSKKNNKSCIKVLKCTIDLQNDPIENDIDHNKNHNNDNHQDMDCNNHKYSKSPYKKSYLVKYLDKNYNNSAGACKKCITCFTRDKSKGKNANSSSNTNAISLKEIAQDIQKIRNLIRPATTYSVK